MLLGVLFYAVARAGSLASQAAALHWPLLWSWLDRANDCAPTFIHVAAMSLLTAGVLGGARWIAWIAALAWVTTDIVFELGQHERLRVQLIGSIPHWLERVWLVDRTRNYFLNGTFDALDIAAAVLGGVTALALMLRNSGEKT